MIRFEPCRPVEADARRVMEWRNDPVTLAMSYHSDPKNWESFWPEFRDRYFPATPTPPPIFALEDGMPVGFLKFDPADGPGVIALSINLAPAARGRGIGQRVLVAVLDYLRERGVTSVRAEVKALNQASIGAFSAAGFQPLGAGRKQVADTGETHDILTFEVRL